MLEIMYFIFLRTSLFEQNKPQNKFPAYLRACLLASYFLWWPPFVLTLLPASIQTLILKYVEQSSEILQKGSWRVHYCRLDDWYPQSSVRLEYKLCACYGLAPLCTRSPCLQFTHYIEIIRGNPTAWLFLQWKTKLFKKILRTFMVSTGLFKREYPVHYRINAHKKLRNFCGLFPWPSIHHISRA